MGSNERGSRESNDKIANAITEISSLKKRCREEKSENMREAEDVFAKIAKDNLKLLKPQERTQVKTLYCKFSGRMATLKDSNILRKEYWRNHEFLSQQIDERSHQIFTMGPLFVPISFLIFAYTAVNKITELGVSYLLMMASLACIFSWFVFYRRAQFLNERSYPYILAYELVLGLSCHFTLKEFYEDSVLVRWGRHVLRFTIFVLGLLWTLYLGFNMSAMFTDFQRNLSRNLIILVLIIVPVLVCALPLVVRLRKKSKSKEK